MILLEHPPVFTAGRRARPEELLWSADELAARGAEVHRIDRGGSSRSTVRASWSGTRSSIWVPRPTPPRISAGWRRRDPRRRRSRRPAPPAGGRPDRRVARRRQGVRDRRPAAPRSRDAARLRGELRSRPVLLRRHRRLRPARARRDVAQPTRGASGHGRRGAPDARAPARRGLRPPLRAGGLAEASPTSSRSASRRGLGPSLRRRAPPHRPRRDAHGDEAEERREEERRARRLALVRDEQRQQPRLARPTPPPKTNAKRAPQPSPLRERDPDERPPRPRPVPSSSRPSSPTCPRSMPRRMTHRRERRQGRHRPATPSSRLRHSGTSRDR